MNEIRFEAALWLPRPRDEVFSFFANARNLQILTPDWLNFEILTAPLEIKTGALFDYRIRVHGFSLNWRTRITEWEPPRRFVDEQLRGPYRLWHHTHQFEEENGGTLCTDRVRYWPRGGALMNWLFVGRDVKRIFAFRQQKLKELFPARD